MSITVEIKCKLKLSNVVAVTIYNTLLKNYYCLSIITIIVNYNFIIIIIIIMTIIIILILYEINIRCAST